MEGRPHRCHLGAASLPVTPATQERVADSVSPGPRAGAGCTGGSAVQGCSLVRGALGQVHTAPPEVSERRGVSWPPAPPGRHRSPHSGPGPCRAPAEPGRAPTPGLGQCGCALGTGGAARGPRRGPMRTAPPAYLPVEGLRAWNEATFLASLLPSSEQPSSMKPSERRSRDLTSQAPARGEGLLGHGGRGAPAPQQEGRGLRASPGHPAALLLASGSRGRGESGALASGPGHTPSPARDE